MLNKNNNHEELAIVVLGFLITIYILYLYEYKSYLSVYLDLYSLIMNPDFHFSPISTDGIAYSLLGSIGLVLLGILMVHLLFYNNYENMNTLLRWLTAIGMGLGFSAFLTLILALLNELYQSYLAVLIIVFILILCGLGIRRYGVNWLTTLPNYWKPSEITIKRLINPLSIGITVVCALIIYHGLLTPIDHFDALIYHAGMAKVMFKYHGIPFIAGPSPGIEMSGNYPPLYSALGAFFFTIMNSTSTDLPLRSISPLTGILTLLTTYQIGNIFLGERKGLIVVSILGATPLFIIYSIYALNYMMATFFITLTTIHLILSRGSKRTYLLLAGFSFGFALSTTYHALFFTPGFLIGIFLNSEKSVKKMFREFIPFFIGISCTGLIWYLRNYLILKNPIWPFANSIFGGLYLDSMLLDLSLQSIRDVGIGISFGGQPDVLDWIHLVLFERWGFPALSVFIIIGLLVVLSRKFKNERWKMIIPIQLFTPMFLMFSLFSFFPRYLTLILPFAAILSAGVISYVFITRRRAIKLVAIMLITSYIIYPGISTALMGKMYTDIASWGFPQDSLWYLKNPGVDYLTDMKRGEGDRVETWVWLNQHLGNNDKVATYESRIYYIKDGGLNHFFFLDGLEARPLFAMEDPEQMIEYLKANNVKYVLILGIVSVGIDILPLIKYLGSPYFPLIYQIGDGMIYNVGPLDNPLLSGEVPAYINNEGWTDLIQVDNRFVRAVIEGDVRPRLLVATPTTVMISIEYLDKGEGGLMVNIYNSYAQEWLYGIAVINKEGTGEWKTYTFIVPYDPTKRFVTLGLNAFKSDFIISKIKVDTLNFAGRSSYEVPSPFISNKTIPFSNIIYLPLMKGDEKLIIEANSYGKKISLEIFEGVIQPWETTQWWNNHIMVARVPDLPTLGIQDPTLIWNAKPGIYTLVIVLWDNYTPDTRIDLSIIIVSSSYEV